MYRYVYIVLTIFPQDINEQDYLPSEPRIARTRSQEDHQGLSSENKIPTRAVQAEDRTTTKFTSNLHEKTSQSSCTGYHRQVTS